MYIYTYTCIKRKLKKYSALSLERKKKKIKFRFLTSVSVFTVYGMHTLQAVNSRMTNISWFPEDGIIEPLFPTNLNETYEFNNETIYDDIGMR